MAKEKHLFVRFCRNDFWKNVSASITKTNMRIEMMDKDDQKAVSTSFRLLTQHLLNYTT